MVKLYIRKYSKIRLAAATGRIKRDITTNVVEDSFIESIRRSTTGLQRTTIKTLLERLREWLRQAREVIKKAKARITRQNYDAIDGLKRELYGERQKLKHLHHMLINNDQPLKFIFFALKRSKEKILLLCLFTTLQ
ncbi:hypothetical protein RhiirA1_457609 [Rhizophagus irregularis]|uniref:Uncharacterized protein n=1 Tax=Rhizophagus irregularis TaxID=588596 RepID=A0A2I1ED70_9GLOM|nr:hypothetical protein RhiirA1_457609 [Rhizophagus irregularis]PKY20076.1 hypothetical protein RhiirB3_433284 [Rhizophagus irregularis]CAB5346079.1 unnamed protein product [Rhizophagus irregularis]